MNPGSGETREVRPQFLVTRPLIKEQWTSHMYSNWNLGNLKHEPLPA